MSERVSRVDIEKKKQRLIRDITEEIEHLGEQLAVVNRNLQRTEQRETELETFAQHWTAFHSQCKKAGASS